MQTKPSNERVQRWGVEVLEIKSWVLYWQHKYNQFSSKHYHMCSRKIKYFHLFSSWTLHCSLKKFLSLSCNFIDVLYTDVCPGLHWSTLPGKVINYYNYTVLKQSFLKYPRTVGIVSIHFINPVSRVLCLISCNTGPNKGNTAKKQTKTKNKKNNNKMSFKQDFKILNHKHNPKHLTDRKKGGEFKSQKAGKLKDLLCGNSSGFLIIKYFKLISMSVSKELCCYCALVTIDNLVIIPTPWLETVWAPR